MPDKIRVDLFLIIRSEILVAGSGRSDPNQNPYLEPPTGRFEFSFNPFKLLSSLVGPKLEKKMICCCIISCIIILLLLVIPLTLAGVTSKLFMKITRID